MTECRLGSTTALNAAVVEAAHCLVRVARAGAQVVVDDVLVGRVERLRTAEAGRRLGGETEGAIGVVGLLLGSAARLVIHLCPRAGRQPGRFLLRLVSR